MATIAYRGLTKAADAVLALRTSAVGDPVREIEGDLQTALSQVLVSIDGAPFRPLDFAVGVRERVDRLMAETKETQMTALQYFLEHQDEALDSFKGDPDVMERFREIVDKTVAWGERNPGKLPPSTEAVSGGR